jgi:hypothetical protein
VITGLMDIGWAGRAAVPAVPADPAGPGLRNGVTAIAVVIAARTILRRVKLTFM